jgi:hypothetical protein
MIYLQSICSNGKGIPTTAQANEKLALLNRLIHHVFSYCGRSASLRSGLRQQGIIVFDFYPTLVPQRVQRASEP